MTCHETQDLLPGYIDGELELMGNLEIERHFEQCRSCALARQKQLELRTLIKEGAPYFPAPDLLTKRVKNALRAADKAKPGLISRRWLAVAASIAIVALAGLFAWSILSTAFHRNANDLLAQEVVSSHVRSLMVSHLTDVPSSDQHTVKPWFDGKLDFAPQVRDLSAQGFQLVGGRLDYVNNRVVAALVYQRQKHFINLFIWPSQGAADEANQESSRQGFNINHWTKSGTSYWAVSDLNNTELREFVRFVRD